MAHPGQHRTARGFVGGPQCRAFITPAAVAVATTGSDALRTVEVMAQVDRVGCGQRLGIGAAQAAVVLRDGCVRISAIVDAGFSVIADGVSR